MVVHLLIVNRKKSLILYDLALSSREVCINVDIVIIYVEILYHYFVIADLTYLFWLMQFSLFFELLIGLRLMEHYFKIPTLV